jgi:LemA protein
MNVEKQLQAINDGTFKGGNFLLGADTDSTGFVGAEGRHQMSAETLEKVIKWRNGIPADATIEQKSEFASSMSKVVSGLNVVVEQYPDLKANDMFGKLQAAIADSEEHLQASRRIYNSNVTIINTAIVTFPKSVVAKKLGIQKKAFFEAEAAKRADVKMEF